jgi:hypothetical protein
MEPKPILTALACSKLFIYLAAVLNLVLTNLKRYTTMKQVIRGGDTG